jgi:hypothetical protein
MPSARGLTACSEHVSITRPGEEGRSSTGTRGTSSCVLPCCDSHVSALALQHLPSRPSSSSGSRAWPCLPLRCNSASLRSHEGEKPARSTRKTRARGCPTAAPTTTNLQVDPVWKSRSSSSSLQSRHDPSEPRISTYTFELVPVKQTRSTNQERKHRYHQQDNLREDRGKGMDRCRARSPW